MEAAGLKGAWHISKTGLSLATEAPLSTGQGKKGREVLKGMLSSSDTLTGTEQSRLIPPTLTWTGAPDQLTSQKF